MAVDKMQQPEEADKAKPKGEGRDYYFQYYSSLQNQANMIGDVARTSAYRKAILGNGAVAFRDKLVIDLGAGSGILSFFAAQAGALNVKSIEASSMAEKVQLLVDRSNSPAGPNPHIRNRIEVLHGKVEDPSIQKRALALGRVDTIVSEPIGVMLFHERMVESFLLARDLFLKPGGSLYPSQGGIWFAPFSDEGLFTETEGKGAFFNQMLFGTDFSVLAEAATEEVFSQPVVGLIPPATLMADGLCARVFDFYEMSIDELKEFTTPVSWIVKRTGVLHGVASWFDLGFYPPRDVDPLIGDPLNEQVQAQWAMADQQQAGLAAWMGGFDNGLNPPALPHPPADGLVVKLDTGPFATRTHWQQARLLLAEPLAVNRGETVSGHLHWKVNDQRSYDLTLSLRIERTPVASTSKAAPPDDLLSRTGKYNLAQQTFNYSYTGEDPTAAARNAAIMAGMANLNG